MEKRSHHRIDGPAPPVPAGTQYAYPGGGRTVPGWESGAGTAPVYPRYQQEGGEAAGISALTFLVGMWLVLAPFALDYPGTGAGFDGSWNDVVIGLAVAVVALVRIALPGRTAALGLVNVGLGAWLVVAPMVLAYTTVPGASPATWNDIVVGIIVMLLAAGSAVIGRRGRNRHTGSTADGVAEPR